MKNLTLNAIILAAGTSSRYNGNKLLENIFEKTVLEWCLEPFLEIDIIEEVIVVVKDSKTLLNSFHHNKIRQVANQNASTGGMASSIVAGIHAVQPDIDGVFIHLADIPCIRSQDLLSMINSFFENGTIITISHKGRRGHPTLIPSKYFKELINLTQYRQGLKDFLINNTTTDVETENDGVLLDLDENFDLENITNCLSKF